MDWLKAFHIIALLIWSGGLLNLSRLLGYHVKEDEVVRARLSRIEKRMYFFVTLPGGILVLLTGVLQLLGVNSSLSVGDSLQRYFVPRDPSGQPTYWYVTFHAKMFCVALLIACDVFMASQILKLAKGGKMPGKARYSALHGIISLLLMIIVILMIAGPLKHS